MSSKSQKRKKRNRSKTRKVAKAAAVSEEILELRSNRPAPGPSVVPVEVGKNGRKEYGFEDVRVMQLTSQKIKDLWAKSVESDLLDDNSERAFEIFYQKLIDPTTIILEVPPLKWVFFAYNTVPGMGAEIHISIWDEDLLGQRRLSKEALQWMVRQFNLRRLTAMIPDWSVEAKNMALKAGFKEEGNLRSFSTRKGKPYDLGIFGILKEELI